MPNQANRLARLRSPSRPALEVLGSRALGESSAIRQSCRTVLTRSTSPQAPIPLAGAETFGLDVNTIGLLLGTMA